MMSRRLSLILRLLRTWIRRALLLRKCRTHLKTFGFKHKCKCAEDYSSGNLVEVTQCFTTMVEEALESCQTLVQENYMLRGMLTQIFAAADIVQGEVPADPNPDDTEDENADA
jgi:hypothetical protein